MEKQQYDDNLTELRTYGKVEAKGKMTENSSILVVEMEYPDGSKKTFEGGPGKEEAFKGVTDALEYSRSKV